MGDKTVDIKNVMALLSSVIPDTPVTKRSFSAIIGDHMIGIRQSRAYMML